MAIVALSSTLLIALAPPTSSDPLGMRLELSKTLLLEESLTPHSSASAAAPSLLDLWFLWVIAARGHRVSPSASLGAERIARVGNRVVGRSDPRPEMGVGGRRTGAGFAGHSSADHRFARRHRAGHAWHARHGSLVASHDPRRETSGGCCWRGSPPEEHSPLTSGRPACGVPRLPRPGRGRWGVSPSNGSSCGARPAWQAAWPWAWGACITCRGRFQPMQHCQRRRRAPCVGKGSISWARLCWRPFPGCCWLAGSADSARWWWWPRLAHSWDNWNTTAGYCWLRFRRPASRRFGHGWK